MATLETAIEWLERLRRLDQGPSADHAKILLEALDEALDEADNLVKIEEFRKEEIDNANEDAGAWRRLRDDLESAGIIEPREQSPEVIEPIIRMFLPL